MLKVVPANRIASSLNFLRQWNYSDTLRSVRRSPLFGTSSYPTSTCTFFSFIHPSFYPDRTYLCVLPSFVGRQQQQMAQDCHPRDPKLALLASTCTPFALTPGLHYAPISYDITFTPSTRTVVDCTVHSLLPAVTLMQPGRRRAGRLPGNVLL